MAAGVETSDHGGSFYNKKEAEFVGCLISRLLRDGIDAKNIGVVTLYKSQQSKIADVLMSVRCVACHLVCAFFSYMQNIERNNVFLYCYFYTCKLFMKHFQLAV